MMGIAACWVAVALVLKVASAAAAFRSRSLDIACFSKADSRLIAPSKVPKKPPFDLEEDTGAFERIGGVGRLPVKASPVSLVFEGVDGVEGVGAADAAAATAEATRGVTSDKQMRLRKNNK